MIYTHRAYNDRNFLEIAATIWEQYTPFVISTQEAAAGAHSLKDIRFPSQCNGSEPDPSIRAIVLVDVIQNLWLEVCSR